MKNDFIPLSLVNNCSAAGIVNDYLPTQHAKALKISLLSVRAPKSNWNWEECLYISDLFI